MPVNSSCSNFSVGLELFTTRFHELSIFCFSQFQHTDLFQYLEQCPGGQHLRTVKLNMFQLFCRIWATRQTISRFHDFTFSRFHDFTISRINNILIFSISAYWFISIPRATSGRFTPSNGKTVHVPTFPRTFLLPPAPNSAPRCQATKFAHQWNWRAQTCWLR